MCSFVMPFSCHAKYIQYFLRALFRDCCFFMLISLLNFVEFYFKFAFQANALDFSLPLLVDQTFLFSSPITARYLRIYSLYLTGAETEEFIRCHMFELIGCVKKGKSFTHTLYSESTLSGRLHTTTYNVNGMY